MNFKVFLVVVICFAQVFAAPRPIDWGQLGRDIANFGRKAVPVVKSGCQLLNGQQFSQYPIYQPQPQLQAQPALANSIPMNEVYPALQQFLQNQPSNPDVDTVI